MFRGALFLAVCLFACPGQAAEKRPWQWQLNPGDVFHVEFHQRVSYTNSLSTGVAQALGGRALPDTHDLAFVFSWKVAEATDPSPENYRLDNKIELTQTLKRVIFSCQFGGVLSKRYDSANPPKDANAGGLFDVHKKCQMHLDEPTKIQLTQNGRLYYDTSAVDWIADSAGEWFFKSHLASDDMGSLLETLLPQFPADAARRHSPWQREVDLGAIVNTGKMTYTYKPRVARGSIVLIRLEGQLDNQAARGNLTLAPINVAGHKCTGEIRFDINRGHVTSAKLHELVQEDAVGIRNSHEKFVQLTIRRESGTERAGAD